ncbi:MAG: peptidylprolyl isomerase, partial [Actinomycetota bacterium]|nr:peptidylprolyl isomerase [Actinomycetota bacterium]
PSLDGSSPHYGQFAAYPPTCIDPAKTYTATLQTDAGNIVITLDAKAAPKTVNNFVFLAGYHFYDNTTFHRVVTGFVDQGGDPTATGSGGPGYSFADELPKQVSDYKSGSVAMANSGPNTNGSQFFILVSDSAGQNLGKTAYSLFGAVTSGMDVALKINTDGSSASAGTPAVVHKVLKVTIAAA